MTFRKKWVLNTVYLAGITVFSPFLLWRILFHGKYRRGLAAKWLGKVPDLPPPSPERKRLWLHAVSVGEVNLLRPLLAKLAESPDKWECVISTTSNTGMEQASRLFGKTHTVFFCPYDFSWAVSRAVRHIKPDCLVLCEQELWPNLFQTVKESGAKIAIVNARLGESGYRNYLWIRFIVKRMLQQVDFIGAQSELYAGWLHRLGARGDTIEVTGSMKFDGAETNRQHPKIQELGRLVGITPKDIVFLAGSTQEPEEAMAVDVFRRLAPEFPQLKLLVVPRHPERFAAVAKLLADKQLPSWSCRSQIKLPPDTGPKVVLVDSMGELSYLWGLCHIAFVGGSMGTRGGQNMLEPAAFGAAVSFGPNTKNFRDIVDVLLRSDSAVVVADEHDLEKFVRRCLTDIIFREELGGRAKDLVQKQLGATERTCRHIAAIWK